MTHEQELRDVEVEKLSAIFHDIYQKEAHRQEDLGIGKARHYDDYEKLSEPVKEFDRVLARYVLSILTADRQRVVEEAQKLKKSNPVYEHTSEKNFNDGIDAVLSLITPQQ